VDLMDQTNSDSMGLDFGTKLFARVSTPQDITPKIGLGRSPEPIGCWTGPTSVTEAGTSAYAYCFYR